MRITCPHCGERGNDEFIYLGDAGLTRPAADAPEAADAFHDYGYLRRNAAGPHEELWFHNAGCHAWLVITRNTLTHEITNVALARDVARARAAERNREAEGVEA